MNAKKLSKKSVNSSEYSMYLESAEKFYSGAEQEVNNSNLPSAAVLIIHAAIAYTDALTIKFGNVKSSGDSHGQAAVLLEQILYLTDIDKNAIANFKKLIVEKNKVSYTGNIPSKSKVSNMMKTLTRYREWARNKLS